MNEGILIAGLILAALGIISPPLALAAGIAYGITFDKNPVCK